MESLTAFAWIVLGVLVRFGLPILLTALVIVGLRRLDNVWQSSAGEPSLAIARIIVENSGCWLTKNCSQELRARCAAYQHRDKPCWMVMRDDHGQMKETCLGCEVFKSAPVPAIGD